MATWRELIETEMLDRGEAFVDVIETTLTDEGLDLEFNEGFGGSNGEPFTLWTANRVYFPVVYDGAEWVGSVPRNPCDEKSSHHGGE